MHVPAASSVVLSASPEKVFLGKFVINANGPFGSVLFFSTHSATVFNVSLHNNSGLINFNKNKLGTNVGLKEFLSTAPFVKRICSAHSVYSEGALADTMTCWATTGVGAGTSPFCACSRANLSNLICSLIFSRALASSSFSYFNNKLAAVIPHRHTSHLRA